MKSDLQLSASQTAHTAGIHYMYIKDFVTSAVEIKLICAAPNFNVVACQLLFVDPPIDPNRMILSKDRQNIVFFSFSISCFETSAGFVQWAFFC